MGNEDPGQDGLGREDPRITSLNKRLDAAKRDEAIRSTSNVAPELAHTVWVPKLWPTSTVRRVSIRPANGSPTSSSSSASIASETSSERS